MAARLRLTGPWRHPDFVRLWVAEIGSSFGSLVTRVALPFVAILVLDATPFQIALLGIADIVPAFLVGLVAGVWVDRLRRRPMKIAADLGRAGVLSTIPLAALLGVLQIGLLYVAVALWSILTIVFDVARQSYLPTLVHRDELVAGNSKLAASEAMVELSASGVGGWLVQWLTAPYAIAVDAVSFLWSAVVLWRIQTVEPLPAPAADRRPAFREIGEGLRFVFGHPVLRPLATSSALFTCAGRMYGTVFLLYVTRELGFLPGVLGLIFALGGATSFAGALAAERIIGRFGIRPALIVSFAMIGAGNSLVALASAGQNVAGAFLITQQFVKDPAWPVMSVAQASLRQMVTPDRWQGRMHASIRVVEFGGMLLGALLGGWLGEALGLRATIAIAAVGSAAAALPLLLARADAEWMRPARLPSP